MRLAARGVRGCGAILGVLFAATTILALLRLLGGPAAAAERPNILWITAEDMSPHLAHKDAAEYVSCMSAYVPARIEKAAAAGDNL